MKIVRDRADARWLPSRFNFALFRLYAFVRLRAAAPEPRPGLILSVERGQNAFENHSMAVVMVIVVASFFPSPLIGVPAAILSLQAAIVVTGLISHRSDISGPVIMLTVIACAVWFARSNIVSAIFVALVALNTIAAATLFLIRRRVAAAEARFE